MLVAMNTKETKVLAFQVVKCNGIDRHANKQQLFNILSIVSKVDPWITQVWTACVNLHMALFPQPNTNEKHSTRRKWNSVYGGLTFPIGGSTGQDLSMHGSWNKSPPNTNGHWKSILLSMEKKINLGRLDLMVVRPAEWVQVTQMRYKGTFWQIICAKAWSNTTGPGTKHPK